MKGSGIHINSAEKLEIINLKAKNNTSSFNGGFLYAFNVKKIIVKNS